MTKIIERYIPLLPFKEAEGEFEIVDFSYTFKGLIINLSKCESEKKIDLRVKFFCRKSICRVANETYRGRLNENFEELFKNIGPCGSLYMVENSNYLQSLSDESYTLTDVLNFKHYFIADSEWTFDIASQEEPRIELFIENEFIKSV
ncbi:MAG TPA: hypothetical protein VGW78_01600 [Candidatus Babeliales bacterium]|jgi:hypothetical protein|nr:hypothetical protein [Candidatus Babeliales bacterium]